MAIAKSFNRDPWKRSFNQEFT